MDLGKDQSHLQLHQTPDHHQRETFGPEIIGTWSLRNREQLRKRKAEAQEKQTSQWAFGEQKKPKWQNTGRGNQRGRKRQQNAEPKRELQTQKTKEMVEKTSVPTEKENEPPRRAVEALTSVTPPQNTMPEDQSSELPLECITHEENSSEYQEIVAQNHSSEICQHMAEPEDLPPNMCQEISALQDHSSKVYQDVAQPEVLAPKTCQEIAVIQTHSFKIWEDIVQSEVLMPKMCQETAVPKAPCTTCEVVTDQERCAPAASLKLEVPQDHPEDTDPDTAEPEKPTLEQEEAGTEGFLQSQKIALPKDLSLKTYQEATEPEYFSRETYKETSVPNSSSHKIIQETLKPEEYSLEINRETLEPEEYSPRTNQEIPGPEEYSPETYQETQEPEDLSIKAYKNENVPEEYLPEPYQETGKAQGQGSKAHGEHAEEALFTATTQK